MPAHISLPLIAALLLNNFVVSQHIGLRRIASLRETWGVGAITALALWLTLGLVWPFARFVLQPLHAEFLDTFIALMILTLIAQFAERRLRMHRPQWFPAQGNHRLLTVTNGAILWLTLRQSIAAENFITAFTQAAQFGIGAALLLIAYQALRDRIAETATPKAWRGPAIDMLCAGFVVIALCGLEGVM